MSSVGQAIGGVVGAVVGFFTPIGPIYGAQIGMMLGGIIDPPKGPTIRGPRLSDLSVQTSTYGAFIPRNYGTVAQLGNVFWLKGDRLTEVANTSSSGGKGGPQTTTQTWSYYATFAVGLCEGPISGVRRIWIGPDLWYDAGSSDIATIIASNEAAAGFTLYLGTDSQQPDPTIQADKGVADTPAYRGLAYIVLQDLPLEKYGNSLMGAQVKVEIVTAATTSRLLQAVDSISGTSYIRRMERVGDYIYCPDSSYTRLSIYDAVDPTALRSLGSVSGISANGVAVSGSYAYVANWSGASIKVCSLLTNSVVNTVSTGFENPYDVVFYGGHLFLPTATSKLLVYSIADPLNPVYVTSVDSVAYATAKEFGGLIYALSTTNLTIIDIQYPSAPVLLGSVVTGSNPYDLDIVGSYAYVVCQNGYTLEIYDVSVPAAPVLVGTSATMYPNPPIGVAVKDGRAFVTSTNDNLLRVYDVSDPTAPTLVDSIATGANPRAIAIAGDYILSCDDSVELRSWFYADGIIASTNSVLGDIVQAECLKSKLLTSGDLDVTALTDSVRGYRIASLGAIRSGLDPLRAAWPFDVVQHGYAIRFVKRGGASVATITAGELDARSVQQSPSVSLTDMRDMDSVLPRKVTLKYLDVTREYDTNEQYLERANTDAVNETVVELPIVLNATEARQKVETLLYLYWMERNDVDIVLPPTYDNLEPADVITVDSINATYQLRLTSVNYLPDGRLECRGKFNAASIYTPVSLGEEGSSTGIGLALAGKTVYVPLDIPLMRDADDMAGFPVAMTGYSSGWPGGLLYRSDDGGQTWIDVQAWSAPGTVMGYASDTLSAHGGTVYDFSGRLTVRLFGSGALASVTETQLFAGQNWFAYGVNGRWEIIAARSAVLQGDGSYILSDLLRGQNGTEWTTGLHAANDSVVLLDANAMHFVDVNSSVIGSPRSYRGITLGKAITSDSDRSFTYNAVNLECLSPVALTGNRHPSTHDWKLEWTRRSRYADWRDYVDAPLGEASEAYEVDIYTDGTYATVKRTLSSLTSATAAYTSAQQVTDFGSNQATLYLKIYQLSATVGRGYALTQSITR